MLYLSDGIPIFHIDGMVGELQAVGFKRIRIFQFSRKTRLASEIQVIGRSTAVPFKVP